MNLTTAPTNYPVLIDSSKYILSYRVYFNDNAANNLCAPYVAPDMTLLCVVRPGTNTLVLWGTSSGIKTWAKVEVEFEYIDR